MTPFSGSRWSGPALAALALAVLLPLVAGGTGMYKWVDKDGNVHFSDRPPEEEQETLEELEIADDLDPARAADAQARLEETQENLDQARTARSAAEAQRLKEQSEASKKAARRQARCHLARSNLQVIEEQRPVYSFNEQGERVYVEDQDREARMEQYRREVAEFCG